MLNVQKRDNVIYCQQAIKVIALQRVQTPEWAIAGGLLDTQLNFYFFLQEKLIIALCWTLLS
jgi:hypothetical protein